MDRRVYEAVLNSEYRSRRYHERRVRQLRRRGFMLVLTILLVLALAISYHAILSEATSGTEDITYKYYTSIEVKYGESLWTIAEEFAGEEYDSINDYIYEVMKINHLKEENISAGQFLIIPYYSAVFK